MPHLLAAAAPVYRVDHSAADSAKLAVDGKQCPLNEECIRLAELLRFLHDAAQAQTCIQHGAIVFLARGEQRKLLHRRLSGYAGRLLRNPRKLRDTLLLKLLDRTREKVLLCGQLLERFHIERDKNLALALLHRTDLLILCMQFTERCRERVPHRRSLCQ